MAPQEPDLPGFHGYDESKCVSTGLSNLYNDSFTCYGDLDGIFSPMMCADGFLPVVVQDEPPQIVDGVDGSGGVAMWYFTCCPPYHASPNATDAIRHCSDPIITPVDFEAGHDESIDSFCNNQDSRQHHRQMKARAIDNIFKDLLSSKIESFLCCDSVPATEDERNSTAIATNFLDELECVPYNNQFYKSFKVQNQIGKIQAIFCDLTEEEFLFPRPIGQGTKNDVATMGRYHCCKSGPALPQFVEDAAFKITVWPTIVLFFIGAIVSAITFIGLLTPLLIQLKNGTYQKPKRGGSGKQRYSTYNLYLVYLSFCDLVYMLFEIVLFGSIIKGRVNPNMYPIIVSPQSFSEEFITWPYGWGNMAINAIVAYQVLDLLQTSHRVQRMNQPSLTRVNLQGGLVCFISAMYGVILYILAGERSKEETNDDLERSLAIYAVMGMSFSVGIFLLQGYVFYVAILIWCRGYIRSVNGMSLRDRAMRQLALYFFRIVAVFILVCLPGTAFQWLGYKGKPWGFLMTYWLGAIQPIITFCMILTKSDAREYIWQLVTLSYLFGKHTSSTDLSNNENANSARLNTTKTFRMLASTRVFAAEDVAADSNVIEDVAADGYAAEDGAADGDVNKDAAVAADGYAAEDVVSDVNAAEDGASGGNADDARCASMMLGFSLSQI